ncbi:AlpA family phage regulatory protein [Gemmobacter lutimaris]|jgi:prophage regulatory protein|uniref:AlpA family phage regulatory protein n=1 Tax=Gemmobacter lutimaris TaxID=2306023 RepID=A0A398BVI9_9RHOB|nr:AlpA family phage regulatory protein [Gemmobacter lutimaris]RID91900.1 AlpA family phage regulatory protein [Gemmobacter lutimaris]
MAEPSYRFMRIKEIEALTSLSRATIYRMISSGSFPAQIKIGHNSVWRDDLVQRWMDEAQA